MKKFATGCLEDHYRFLLIEKYHKKRGTLLKKKSNRKRKTSSTNWLVLKNESLNVTNPLKCAEILSAQFLILKLLGKFTSKT
jgi:hypothetical protein